jgi:hypothetical protein
MRADGGWTGGWLAVIGDVVDDLDGFNVIVKTCMESCS